MNSKKTILVTCGSRKFPVTITSSCDGSEDYDKLCNTFSNIVARDAQLKSKAKKILRFTYLDKVFGEQVDLYPGATIEDGFIVELSFLDPYESPQKTEVQEHAPRGQAASRVIFEDPKLQLVDNFYPNTEKNMQSKLEVLNETPYSVTIQDIEDNNSSQPSTSRETGFALNQPFRLKILSELTKYDKSNHSPVEDCDVSFEPPVSPCSVGNTSEPEIQENSVKNEPPTKRAKLTPEEKYLTKPTFPTFSSKVQDIINDGTVVHKPKDFVREAAYHLFKQKHTPLSTDYSIYAKGLLKLYPSLANLPKAYEHTECFMALSQMISARIRMIRHEEKKLNLPGSSKQTSSVYHFADKPRRKTKAKDKDVLEDGVPVKEMVKVLESEDSDLGVVLEVLKKTKDTRRKFIENAANVKEIFELYPAYKNSIVLMAEHKLVSDFTDDYFQLQFVICMQRLGKIFSYKGDIMDNQVVQFKILHELEDTLQSKKKKDPYALTVVQVGKEVPDAEKYLAPHAWIATNGKSVHSAFMFAEGMKVCKIIDPERDVSCLVVLQTIMAFFYAFHREYPDCSKQFYEFIDYAIFGKSGDNEYKGNSSYNNLKIRYLKI